MADAWNLLQEAFRNEHALKGLEERAAEVAERLERGDRGTRSAHHSPVPPISRALPGQARNSRRRVGEGAYAQGVIVTEALSGMRTAVPQILGVGA